MPGPGSGVWSPGPRGQAGDSHSPAGLDGTRTGTNVTSDPYPCRGGWAPSRVQSYPSRRHLPHHQAFPNSYSSLKTSWLCNHSDQPLPPSSKTGQTSLRGLLSWIAGPCHPRTPGWPAPGLAGLIRGDTASTGWRGGPGGRQAAQAPPAPSQGPSQVCRGLGKHFLRKCGGHLPGPKNVPQCRRSRDRPPARPTSLVTAPDTPPSWHPQQQNLGHEAGREASVQVRAWPGPWVPQAEPALPLRRGHGRAC